MTIKTPATRDAHIVPTGGRVGERSRHGEDQRGDKCRSESLSHLDPLAIAPMVPRWRADAAIVLSRHDTVNYGKRGRVIPTLRALLDASHTLRYPAPMPITEDILREMRVRR